MTGLQPASLALSPDGNTLYVANLGSLRVSVISLISQQVVDYPIGSRPDAIAVGNDGKVVILGTAGLLRLDTTNGTVSAVPITPPPTPAAGLPNIPNSPTPVGATAGLVTTASGNLIIGLSVQVAPGCSSMRSLRERSCEAAMSPAFARFCRRQPTVRASWRGRFFSTRRR